MSSFKIDLSTAVTFVAVEPKHKVINRETGEVAIDRETGAKMMTLGLTVADEGEANRIAYWCPGCQRGESSAAA